MVFTTMRLNPCDSVGEPAGFAPPDGRLTVPPHPAPSITAGVQSNSEMLTSSKIVDFTVHLP